MKQCNWLCHYCVCTYIHMCIAQNCTKENYYKWSPSDNLIDNECILREKEIFEHKLANHLSLNGGQYERYINKSVCPHTREDYEWYRDFYYVHIFTCTIRMYMYLYLNQHWCHCIENMGIGSIFQTSNQQ